jgi:hypothetical protein
MPHGRRNRKMPGYYRLKRDITYGDLFDEERNRREGVPDDEVAVPQGAGVKVHSMLDDEKAVVVFTDYFWFGISVLNMADLESES